LALLTAIIALALCLFWVYKNIKITEYSDYEFSIQTIDGQIYFHQPSIRVSVDEISIDQDFQKFFESFIKYRTNYLRNL
jgi:hypothetical protein